MQLRLQGNAEARGGDLKAAEEVFSRALELDISRGKHLLHANRSGVRLTLGKAQAALEDAEAAVKLAPRSFTTAYVRQVLHASPVSNTFQHRHTCLSCLCQTLEETPALTLQLPAHAR